MKDKLIISAFLLLYYVKKNCPGKKWDFMKGIVTQSGGLKRFFTSALQTINTMEQHKIT